MKLKTRLPEISIQSFEERMCKIQSIERDLFVAMEKRNLAKSEYSKNALGREITNLQGIYSRFLLINN